MSLSEERPYQPFRYPPDYHLARTHQQASMPGKQDKRNPASCSCCNEKVKYPFKSWWRRSIEKDFSKFGGAVVSYFWLIKLYIVSCLLILILYGGYLHYLSDYYCGKLSSIDPENKVCSKLWGFWIITNEDLYQLIEDEGDDGTSVRYFTLRSIAFFILLLVNFLSLFIIKWFKMRFPPKVNIANFSLLFKNLKKDDISELVDQIKKETGPF